MTPRDSYPYLLPRIDFVGGETQELYFDLFYWDKTNMPYDLDGKTAQFSVVKYINRMGDPILSKKMTIRWNDERTIKNVVSVILKASETYDLYGKYVYQISIKDSDGVMDIPKQGILMVFNNIDKSFI